jgi:hypothetical protein
MKVGKNQNLYIFWLPTRNNNKNLEFGRIFFPKFGKFEPFFNGKNR